jgi:hypothetical protein
MPLCALLTSALLGKNAGMCPLLLEAMPAKLGNANAIDMVFPMTELGGSTPTDRALSHVVDALIPTIGQPMPDGMPQGPTYVILATDGAPNDICVGGVGGDGVAQQQGVIAAVDRAAIALSGTVEDGQECLGTVEQNGEALSCCRPDASGALRCGGMPSGSPNGWRLSDPHSIELLGDACAKFLLGSGASLLNARFPCAVFTPS